MLFVTWARYPAFWNAAGDGAKYLGVVIQRSVMAKPTNRKANTRNVTPLNTRKNATAQIQMKTKKQRHNKSKEERKSNETSETCHQNTELWEATPHRSRQPDRRNRAWTDDPRLALWKTWIGSIVPRFRAKDAAELLSHEHSAQTLLCARAHRTPQYHQAQTRITIKLVFGQASPIYQLKKTLLWYAPGVCCN